MHALMLAALLSTAQCPGGVCPAPASVRPVVRRPQVVAAPQAFAPVVRESRPRLRLFGLKRRCK